MIVSPNVSSRVKSCIVHIGMHKTGSSSIQETLFNNLTDPGFEYADLGLANQSTLIYTLFSDEPENYHKYRKLGLKKTEVNQIIQDNHERLVTSLQKQSSSTIIFSAEELTLLNTESELPRFKNFLSECFDTIQIIGYVRAPHTFMESVFQEKVKSGSFDNLNFNNLYPKYRNKFQKFDHIFGRNNVQLVKFDTNYFPKGDVVLDFCQRLNINISPMGNQYFNESISKEAVAIMFAYNKYGPGLGIGRNVLKEIRESRKKLSLIGSNNLKFSPDLLKSVLETNRDDIKWMETRLGESIEEDIQSQEGAWRSEDDILDIPNSSINALRELLGDDTFSNDNNLKPAQYVAQLVHALRLKLRDVPGLDKK